MFAIMAIPLTQGFFALVDGKNYEWLSGYNWCALKDGRTYYAVRCSNHKRVAMHREILGLTDGDGKNTDHVNHCGLDNRERNIRICTKQQNSQNRRISIRNKSGYKGVSWNIAAQKWQVYIYHENINYFLGCFKDKTKAAKAYDKKAREWFGEFAHTNF